MTKGYFAFVLHNHLPYVIAHGRWPHGMDWLSEAAAETYMQLVKIMNELVGEGGESAVFGSAGRSQDFLVLGQVDKVGADFFCYFRVFEEHAAFEDGFAWEDSDSSAWHGEVDLGVVFLFELGFAHDLVPVFFEFAPVSADGHFDGAFRYFVKPCDLFGRTEGGARQGD